MPAASAADELDVGHCFTSSALIAVVLTALQLRQAVAAGPDQKPETQGRQLDAAVAPVSRENEPDNSIAHHINFFLVTCIIPLLLGKILNE